MREKFRIIKLPLITYCGINFNNSNWSGHLRFCETCKREHEEYRNKYIESWDKKCECGCGQITQVGNKRILGHGSTGSKKTEKQKLKYSEAWTDKRRKEQSEKWKNDNPLFKIKNRKYGNDNPAKRKEVKIKISKNNPMKNEVYREKAVKNRKEVGYEKTIPYLKNRWKDKKLLEQRINTYTKNLSEGKINIKNNWKCGYYYTKKGDKEWYDSSYEEIRMIYYDNNNINWTKKHGIRIPYINEKGINTYYVPDFKIIINDIIIIEEIKGWIKKNDKLKAMTAIKYCEENYYKYNFFLGKEFKKIDELSYG